MLTANRFHGPDATTEGDYPKLSGGGVKPEGPDDEVACQREALEQTGCDRYCPSGNDFADYRVRRQFAAAIAMPTFALFSRALAGSKWPNPKR